jgi:hypothetical protein
MRCFAKTCQVFRIVIIGIMLTLTLLEGRFTLHRLEPDTVLPETILRNSFFAITRTDDELSIVLPESVEIESNRSEPGWACFKVEGPLEFNLTGILAEIASVLANAKIPIFALSTFDTDYILVKRKQAETAKEALLTAGYAVRG